MSRRLRVILAILLGPGLGECQINPMSLTSDLRHPHIQALLVQIRANQSQIERHVQILKTPDIRYLPGQDPRHKQSRAAIASLQKQQDALRHQAIQETIGSFGLIPDRWAGPILDPGAFKGLQASFKVVFRPEAAGRELLDKKRKKHYLDPKADQRRRGENKRLAGVTWPDGLITVTEHAFQSPGYLAATIWHEIAHWDQMTAKDERLRYDRRDRSIREMHAIQRTMGAEHARDFGLTPDEERDIKAYYDYILSHPPQEYFHSVITSGRSLMAPTTEEVDGRFPHDSLADILRKAARLEANIERRNEEARAAREAWDAVDSTPIDGEYRVDGEKYEEASDPRRVHGVPLPPAGGAREARGIHRGLLALAGAACSSRAGVSVQAAAAIKADGRRYPARPGGSLCVRALYDALLSWNLSAEKASPVDAAWLNGQAAPFFPPPEPAPSQPAPQQPPPPFKEPPRMGQPGTGPARRQLDGIRRGSGGFN